MLPTLALDPRLWSIPILLLVSHGNRQVTAKPSSGKQRYQHHSIVTITDLPTLIFVCLWTRCMKVCFKLKVEFNNYCNIKLIL